MQIIASNKPASKRWKIAGTLLIGFVSSTFLLAATPSSQGEISESQPSYSYPFARSLNHENQQTIEREISFYQGRVQQNPIDGLDRAALAGAYLKMGRATGADDWYSLAKQEAEQSLANLPFANDGAVMVLAEIAQAEHEFAKALSLVEPLSGEKPLAVVVTSSLATGQLEDAETAANTLVDFVPSLGSLSLRGVVRKAMGDRVGAMQDFEQAITAEEPSEQRGSAQVRTFLGNLYAEQGDLQQARPLYQEALEIVPDYPFALLHLAELETRLGRYRAAESHYTRISNLPSLYDVGLQGIARVKSLQGKPAESEWQGAEAYLRENMNGSALSHRRDLAHLLLERGRDQDVDEAIILMQTELENRRDAGTLDLLAWSLLRAGRYQEAQTFVKEALEQGAKDAGIFYRAADIETALNNPVQAEEYIGSAKAVDSTFNQQTRQRLGQVALP